jgi:hypothetical protein
MKIALAICTALSVAWIVLIVLAWRSVDPYAYSTNSLAYVFLPIWAVVGLVVIWGFGFGGFLWIRAEIRDRRFAKRNAKAS